MNLLDAAKKTVETMDAESWPRHRRIQGDPDSFYHVEWMLKGIIEGYIKGEKAHRWLGWAQAVIHIHQEVPLDVFKDFNS